MIVYKVVEKKTRWGSNWTIFKHSYIRSVAAKNAVKFRKKHPEFFPHYYKGRVIKAAPDSPGIMCFETRRAAETFIFKTGIFSTAITIKVKGIGPPREVHSISPECGIYPWKIAEGIRSGRPPRGTIGFQAVKVLE